MSTVATPTAKSAISKTRKTEGFHTVTPHLICGGAAKAIEFYKAAFGAVEIDRLPGPNGLLMHASIRIGDSIVMLFDEFPDMDAKGPLALKGTPIFLHLYVENADAVFEQAVRAGAKVHMPLQDMFWGDRYGQLVDPFGHTWSIATHLCDLTPEQIRENMKTMGTCG